jgi:hypothetical protein
MNQRATGVAETDALTETSRPPTPGTFTTSPGRTVTTVLSSLAEASIDDL